MASERCGVAGCRCEVKVIDLGSSCFTSDVLGSYVQSRAYRAPEVVVGLPYGQAVDLWSLGAILAELLSARVLFQVSAHPGGGGGALTHHTGTHPTPTPCGSLLIRRFAYHAHGADLNTVCRFDMFRQPLLRAALDCIRRVVTICKISNRVLQVLTSF